ncbi:glycosyltransferase [Chitinophaga sp.]|uniref:glycosyltransferase family 2 protein n=1 Tax=Chitinophaga sp. TaxID=1869181 RepID=UPI0031DA1560
MRVAALMLSYNRYELLQQTIEHNRNNAGHPFDLYIWDNGSTDSRVRSYLNSLSNVSGIIFEAENVGIARPFNSILSVIANKYDAFIFMANDILEPDNWLRDRVNYMQTVLNSGMVSISVGDHNYPSRMNNGMIIHPGHVIGQFMISREVFDTIGYMREDFGLYGPIDNDYNVRCERMGYVNYYLPAVKAIHLDDKDDIKYGYSKSEQVSKTWPEFVNTLQRYIDIENIYIPFDGQMTIDMKEYVQ